MFEKNPNSQKKKSYGKDAIIQTKVILIWRHF